ncbi:alpha/beta-hydrolase [Sistotremastrum suecicum HHB10207 ss-3]|uniref:Alpha/beta-hydrolase n=1 Tax=Sistotremastrum suecicum HHB10207 ss-3 TaxID=1314776 RepID=A0A166BDA1_9AGAM|nr:alpha/beta-hydrolase [Sistotremastrum suecicum HHB10207 ss-3]
MDYVKNEPSTDIYATIASTYQAFVPLLKKNEDAIKSVTRTTHQFGDDQVSSLDVYSPSTPGPILFFTFGGGFVSGSRIIPNTGDLVYANLGAYFAKKGFVTVIANYHLVPTPEAVFPSGPQDISKALTWVVNNLKDQADVSKIYFYGHSVGALHQSSLLLHPDILSPDLRSRIKAAVLNGGPYHFLPGPARDLGNPDVLSKYFPGEDGTIKNAPLGLLQSASEATVKSLPPLYIIVAEKEPEAIALAAKDFKAELKKRGVAYDEFENQYHNHISANIALSSGEGEEWGERVVEWIKAH